MPCVANVSSTRADQPPADAAAPRPRIDDQQQELRRNGRLRLPLEYHAREAADEAESRR